MTGIERFLMGSCFYLGRDLRPKAKSSTIDTSFFFARDEERMTMITGRSRRFSRIITSTTIFLLALCATAVRLPKQGREKEDTVDESSRPNILFVVMDDLASNDLGIHGSGIQTPVADELAHTGLYLNKYYVLPTCTTTRIALMTGRYPYNDGNYEVIRTQSRTAMSVSEETLPELLARGGYQRHAVGKWHLGHAKYEYSPTFRGFDSFFGFYAGGSQDHYSHVNNKGQYDMRWDKNSMCGQGCSVIVDEQGVYSSFLFAREAKNVIQQHQKKKGPLFLYLAFQALHKPGQVPLEYTQIYENSSWDAGKVIYSGMLTAADEALGDVIEELKLQQLWNNTIVVYTTDNGGARKWGSNGILRGFKQDVFEGGIAGDGIISGPAITKFGVKTGTFNGLFHAVDWFPTIAAMLDVPPIGKPLDGVNQYESLKRGGWSQRHEAFLGYSWRKGEPMRYAALRQGNWKLVFDMHRNSSYLYNLDRDVRERHDLSRKNFRMVNFLETLLGLYVENFGDPVEEDRSCQRIRSGRTDWGEKAFIPWCDDNN